MVAQVPIAAASVFRAKQTPDCSVTSKSCEHGCATTNSCGKCTGCKGNLDCNVTPVSCEYGCNTNSCGVCTSCKTNPDCNIASKSCDYGCATTNSCGKCTGCEEIRIVINHRHPVRTAVPAPTAAVSASPVKSDPACNVTSLRLHLWLQNDQLLRQI